MNNDEIFNELKKVTNISHISPVLKKIDRNNHICELGVRKGNNLARLLNADPSVLVGIDSWKDDGVASRNDINATQLRLDSFYKTTLERFKNFGNVKIIREYSFNAYKQFDDDYFDYIFIDADHSYEGVKKDIEVWYPKLKINGILAGHDYCDVFAGVKKAVNEYIEEKKIQYLHITNESNYKSWITIKENK